MLFKFVLYDVVLSLYSRLCVSKIKFFSLLLFIYVLHK